MEQRGFSAAHFCSGTLPHKLHSVPLPLTRFCKLLIFPPLDPRLAEAWRGDPDLRRWRSEAILSAIAARNARLAAKIPLTNRNLALKGGSPFFFEDDGLARWAHSYLDHIALFAAAEQVEIYAELETFDRRCERFFSYENVSAKRVEFGTVFRVERVLAEHAAGKRGFIEAAGMSYMLGEAVGTDLAPVGSAFYGAQRETEVVERVAQLTRPRPALAGGPPIIPYGPLPGVAGGACLDCGNFAMSPWMLPDQPSFIDTWAIQRKPSLAFCGDPDEAGLRTCSTLSGARVRCFEAAPAASRKRAQTVKLCVPASFTETKQVPPMCNTRGPPCPTRSGASTRSYAKAYLWPAITTNRTHGARMVAGTRIKTRGSTCAMAGIW